MIGTFDLPGKGKHQVQTAGFLLRKHWGRGREGLHFATHLRLVTCGMHVWLIPHLFPRDVLLRWFWTIAKYRTGSETWKQQAQRYVSRSDVYTIFVTVVVKVPPGPRRTIDMTWYIDCFYFSHWSMQLLASDSSQASELSTFLLCHFMPQSLENISTVCVPTIIATFLSKIALSSERFNMCASNPFSPVRRGILVWPQTMQGKRTVTSFTTNELF